MGFMKSFKNKIKKIKKILSCISNRYGCCNKNTSATNNIICNSFSDFSFENSPYSDRCFLYQEEDYNINSLSFAENEFFSVD